MSFECYAIEKVKYTARNQNLPMTATATVISTEIIFLRGKDGNSLSHLITFQLRFLVCCSRILLVLFFVLQQF